MNNGLYYLSIQINIYILIKAENILENINIHIKESQLITYKCYFKKICHKKNTKIKDKNKFRCNKTFI